jgi:hypothetical protein
LVAKANRPDFIWLQISSPKAPSSTTQRKPIQTIPEFSPKILIFRRKIASTLSPMFQAYQIIQALKLAPDPEGG